MSNKKKIKLIAKYARIRLKRFWKEWGVSKEEAMYFLECTSIFALIFLMCIIK